MPDHNHIYQEEAEKYHLLISKQPLLDQIVEQIVSLEGLNVADVGAGTGRLTVALAPKVKSIVAFDASSSMLDVTVQRLKEKGLFNWQVKVADHRSIPLEDQSVDLVVAGWTIAYIANDEVENGKQHLHTALTEMQRILKPGGTIIIFETMGTGVETPNPPAILTNYYERLEKEYGFEHRTIRMDYQFENNEQAVALSEFFFGDELANKVREQQTSVIPECAGVWWLHKVK